MNSVNEAARLGKRRLKLNEPLIKASEWWFKPDWVTAARQRKKLLIIGFETELAAKLINQTNPQFQFNFNQSRLNSGIQFDFLNLIEMELVDLINCRHSVNIITVHCWLGTKKSKTFILNRWN